MSWWEIIWRLGIAAIIGGTIGIDRELHHKGAGFRTIAIVCIGSAIAALASVTASFDAAAPSRVLQGILAGIGFLGTGVIIHHARVRSVEGLTTAASVWTAAAIGAVCGLGLWKVVIVSSALMLILLIAAGSVERALRHQKKL